MPLPVIGRFAPSPTGELHFGSLVAAVGSYLEAKSRGGRWLLRIEDIDPPREVAGSAERIIADLQRLGMEPDGPVLFQSQRLKSYQQAIRHLLARELAYPCACTRKDLPESGIYPGTCRTGIAAGKQPRSMRFKLADEICEFDDRVQGRVMDCPADSSGDFIIRRADGLYAYQLAVVVDDAFQGITEVVRGADLLDSTARQVCLQKALGLPTPKYMHLPVVVRADDRKLSKREQADPVKHQDPTHAVARALAFLGHQAPSACSLQALWDWALEHWDRQLIPRSRSVQYPI
ncbi:MAG: tRNA glutamyl-Q(34) synthetase GluQRS [Xanthomonadales bacterium]|nr:tRNA glutamyl-Q(34) synthetase GluQRS [Xanthomonadales bacterium]